MVSVKAPQNLTMRGGEPIAIVGTGCRFPGGASSPSKLWEMLLDKRDALRAIPMDRWNSEGFHHSNGERAGALNVKHAYLLRENVREWDASFFGINPREAEAVDPQHRILLETVYEAMESGGFTMEAMQGSDTAVYVGVMTADYCEMLLRSPESLPTYFATGTNSSILSNRLSYFYDLKGPSETINTACSSSLVAVHRGVQSLRSGEARMAIAGGANLILNPEFMASESNLHMLSAEGRSRMWDAGANGYARGEGFAAVIMKRLSDAIADGDDITCIIRETGVNSDGRTKGITLPSGEAQTSLIQQVYRRAGLNPFSALDRPQYFEAHGTGTPAGDPIEANGIRDAFFAENVKREGENLIVGSVKTAMGHTEGTAGLAGLIKTANAIKLGVIPGNLLFQSYNPKILPLLDHLALATETQAWPAPPAGQPRRASVNCFGFGGTNAHAIVESYSPAPALHRKQLMPASTQTPMAIPLVLSANNEASLATMVSNYRDFIASNDQINLNDLAWTLQNRRSELALKVTFAGPSREALLANMTAIIGKTQQSPPAAIGTRCDHRSKSPRILGVFTGQGAQWANMGRELVLSSSMAKASVVHLDAALAELPDGPAWTLEDVICDKQAGKRIDEAEFSQPVCTAVQVMLVDILRSVGHKFTTVVGHSSGEIGAAYAAGVVSASEAIKIAYYRGLHTKLAQGPSGKEGTMLAAGLSHEDADEFCAQPALSGRIQVAASNAPESVTLSGDIDAIKEAKIILDDRGIFARALKVNKAYHSQHMNPVSVPYMASLRACLINPKLPSDGCTWVSSVTGDPIIDEVDLKALKSVYWKDNMLKPVLFSTAVEQAVLGEEPFDFAIEVGPHTALKGPFLQTYKAATGVSLPYGGTLARFTNDIAAMSNCLGGLMNHVAPSALTTSEYIQSFQSGVAPALATGLPTYAWDHSQIYWGETRYSRKYRQRSKPRHDLLGAQLPDDLEHDMRYRNTIRVSETPWLAGHKVQGQIVYPGAAYLVMALEASKDLAKDKQTKLVELLDIELSRAIALEEGSAGVDTLLTLKKTHEGPLNGEDLIEAEFSIFSAIGVDAETWDLNMKGRLRVVLADSNTPDIILPVRDDTPVLLSTLNVESFYNSLVKIGFNYTGLFHRLTGISRRMNRATATAIEYPEDPEMPAMMHPALMDASFQTVFAALHFPGDGGMASPYLPTGIKCLRISTDRDEAAPATQVTIDTFITSNENTKIVADIEMCDSTTGAPRLQIEGLACTSLERANADNDVELYSQTIWRPEVSSTASKFALSAEGATAELSMVDLCERLAYMYLRKLDHSVARKEVETFSWNHQRIFQFIDHLFPVVENGQHPTLRAEWAKDDPIWLETQAAKHMDQVDIQLITTVGQNLLSVVRGETNLLECMMKDDMLNRYYALGQQIKESNVSLSRAVGQVVHRYAGMKILEVGAGNGSVTKGVFEEIGHLFKSYIFTDFTDKSFEKARENLQKWTGKMKFQPLEIEGDVTAQGFEKHSFDMVIASNVVQTSQNLQRTMENIRLLLKPGGYVLLQEISVPDVLRVKFMTLGLPAWWLGDDDSRRFGPAASMSQWTSLLKETGFSGVDQVTNDLADRPMFMTSVVLSQALSDEVKFLREPLCPPALPIVLKDICIIGGNQARNAEITAYISESCRRLGNELPRLSYIDSIDKAHLHTTPFTSVIFVQDLDQPIWKDLKQETITGLQSVVDQARQVLWVTSGCRLENAYANMSVGVGRGMQSEYAHVQFQLLDIEPSEAETSNDLIAAASLRLFADDAIRAASPNILWTAESELVVKNGKFLIPRITADQVLNNRLNARRRPIQKKVSPAETQVMVSESEGSYVLSEPHLSMIATKDTSAIKIKVTHSLLSAVKVGENMHMYLTIGKVVEGGDIASGKDVLAFSNINASIIDVPASQVVPIYVKVDSPPRFIESVANTFVSTALFSKLRHGSAVLFLGPDRSLASAFQATAEALGLKIFSASTLPVPAGSKTIYINPHTPERILRNILPAKVDMVLDFSGLDQPSSISALQGSAECINTKVHDLFGKKPSSGINEAPDYLHDELLKAHFVAANFVDRSEDPEIVSLSQISNSKTRAYPAVLDFTKASEVSVQIAPINTKELFRSDKTYLLVGCTGGLGQALCRWMVYNGAKHLALTTRNPKSVNQVWLDEMAAAGGNIQIFACDVTDGTSLRKTHEEICRKMPQIVGVANAAMVLADRLFNDITLEDFQISLRPKVDGTNQLDELFGERSDLDFFILFSSLANTVGNRGQTNYLAANGYMQTIAAQRRARGLTASVMHIGMVIGIGVVSQDAALESSLKRQKWMAISEPEFLDMFAECILVGRPNSGHSNDIITGLPRNSTLPRADNPWYASNPRFSHMVLKEEGEDNSSTGGSSLPIKQRLAAATTAEQRAEIIQGDFLQKMSRILQASAENIEVKQPLLALGVDSLMAMEIRSWFLSSIDVDVPVLKVLGGGSIQTLCAEAGALVKIVNESAGEIDISITKGTSPPSEASASSGASTPSLLATRPSTPGLSEDFTWLSRAGSETGEYDGVELLPGMERVGRMSFSQERLWFLQSFLTNPATYNITLAYRIKGPFRVADFNQAFYDLIDRHETLRTAFFTDKTNYLAYLGAVEKTPFVMVQKPYTGEAQVKDEFNLTNNHSYDLENAESMKATLLIESPTSHVLIMGFHHIAVDATSSQILVRDIAAIYSGDKLAPLKYQYIDYASKQRATVEQALSKDVAYWKSEFPDVPETLPLFDFGTVKSRKPLTEYNIRIIDARLDASFTATLKAASQKLRVTPFHLHLATLQTMLHKLLNIEDVCIGITDANKNDPDHVDTLGFFVNLLPLRFKVEGSRSFAKLTQQARDKTLAALEHSQIPYNVLLDKLEVPRSTTSNPMFQVLMNYKMGSLRSVPFGECEAEVVDFQDASNPYDLQFDVELAVDGTTLITVSTQSYLYSEEDLSTVLKSYTHLLKTLSSKPSLPIKDQSVFSIKEAHKAIAIGTGPRVNIDQSITINRMFDWAVKARSNNIAVVDNVGGKLTWIEMASWVSTIAAHLLGLGVRPQAFVGVNCEPSAMSVCYWLAVIRIGAIYVPLDTSNPAARLELIVNDCKPVAIICDEQTWAVAQRAFRAPNRHIFKLSDIGGRRTKYTEDMSKPHEIACVIYTSGTTGTPKGTLLTNSNFVNHIYGVNKEWDIGREVVLQPTNLGFDLSLAQMMQFVASQGKLVVASLQTRTDPMALVNLMVEHQVTYTIVTPSVYALILRQDPALLQQLTAWRTAFSCGEPLTSAIVQQFQKVNLPNLRLLNSCGPTEITIINSAWEIPLQDPNASEQNMIVGSSLPNYSTYILDEHLNPVPVGFPGEMVCGGASISQGYLGQAELTAAKWVADPFASDADLAKGWDRMYRTGDRAKMLPDGRFVFLGRIAGDNQVKLRGVRIELDDIRSTIVRESKGSITEAAVCLRGEGENAFLVAFVVLSRQITDTRKFLAGLPLPSAMIPNTFVTLDILPRTPNGKIDMRALAALDLPSHDSQQKSEDSAPIDLTMTEASLKEIWSRCLPAGVSVAGVRGDSDFFVLGGNSMLLVNVQAMIRDTFNANIALYTLFQSSTLESMAAQIEAVSQVETTVVINWDSETALDPRLSEPSPHSLGLRPVSRSYVEIILTGATGFLGTQILRELVADERVGKIHCIAIRLPDGKTSRSLPIASSKIVKYYGDLASERLGLTDAQFTELSKKADRIIHNGCDVSFLKSYKSLSASNLGSTKELVRLAMVRKTPFHFVSTAGVASFIPEQDLGERFIPDCPPPVDGSMGYAASKWAGEKYLLAAATQLGLPVWVHRPSNILGEGAASVNMTANILEYSIRVGAVPRTPGIDGHMQFVEVDEVAYLLVNSLFARSQDGAVVKNHCGDDRVRIRELGTYLENKFGRKLAVCELDDWVEEVQKAGLSVGLGSLIREVLRNSAGTASLKTLSKRRY